MMLTATIPLKLLKSFKRWDNVSGLKYFMWLAKGGWRPSKMDSVKIELNRNTPPTVTK